MFGVLRGKAGLAYLPLPATDPSCEPNGAAEAGTLCLPVCRGTIRLLHALGASCKGGLVALQIAIRKVLLLAFLIWDAVNQIPGLEVWWEEIKEKLLLLLFFFKSKSALEILLSCQKWGRKERVVPLWENLPNLNQKTSLLPDCKEQMLEDDF